MLQAEVRVSSGVLAPWARCSVAVLSWLRLDSWLCGSEATQPLGPLFSRVRSLCAREDALMWTRHCRGGCPADAGGECWPPFRRLVPIVLLRRRWAPRSEAGGFHPWGCPTSLGKSATLASQGLTLLRAAPPAGTGWMEASREAGLGGATMRGPESLRSFRGQWLRRLPCIQSTDDGHLSGVFYLLRISRICVNRQTVITTFKKRFWNSLPSSGAASRKET